MSSALYDATLASLDFRTLLPGLWGLGTDEGESDQETIKGSAPTAGTSSEVRKVGARSGVLVDEFDNLSMKPTAPAPRADGAPPAVDVPSGQGMARGKKRSNAGKNHKRIARGKQNEVTTSKKKHASATAARPHLGGPNGGALTSTGSANSPAVNSSADQAAYPSVFFDDDLSAAPLYPPPLRRTLTRDLPRVELENSHRAGPPLHAAGSSTGSISSSDEVRIEHADTARMHPTASDDESAGAERWSTYRSHSDWVDGGGEAQAGYPDGEDDFTSSSSGAGYSADESPYSEDDDDDDERSSFEGDEEPRPFPNPRLKTQQKYIRPPEHDIDYPPSSRAAHPAAFTTADAAVATAGRTSKPNLLSGPVHSPPAPAAVTAYSYVPSLPASTLSHLSPYASPLISPTLSTAPSHEVRIEAVPSALPSPTSEDALQYDTAAAAAYYSAQEEYYRSAAEDTRGRNPHPRLLWRSVLDRDALEVLDAHHERVRGGPLPRLALPGYSAGAANEEGLASDPELKRVCLGASGLEREREHTGVGDDQMKERVRRARGRRDPNRRTWSQAGRQWSRQMEQCGL
ncbi:hypothetical protein JCM3774_005621 [Rhodotorula dairenensis]